MSKKLTNKECIEDLETLRQFFLTTCGAEPMCLSHAISIIKTVDGYAEVKVVGETKDR